MNAEANLKTHGMQGAHEAPDWPPLTLPEVDAVLRLYPQAGGATALLSHSPRPFSAASIVATPHGRVFVKRHHHSVRDRDGLLEEHRFLAHLANATPLAQAPLANADGETVMQRDKWVYEVHPVAQGMDVYEEALSWTPFLSTGHAGAAGRALARLHNAAESFEDPSRQPRQLVTSYSIFAEGDGDPIARMESYLQARPMLQSYTEARNWKQTMTDLHFPFYANLQPLLSELKPLWTHNDFHASNLMWSSSEDHAEVTAIVDFGLADRTNAIHDLATTIERNIIEWLRLDESNLVRYDHLDALLQGYLELHPLTYAEARALPAMLPLVHCEFALSETDYFLSILHSEAKAALAYEGYFIAHTEWFRGAQGQQLLGYLNGWADRSTHELADPLTP